MAQKLSKAVAAAKLVIAQDKLDKARQTAKHGQIWQGVPRPVWAAGLLKRAHERVAEENERAAKSKAGAAAKIEKLEAEVKNLTAACK